MGFMSRHYFGYKAKKFQESKLDGRKRYQSYSKPELQKYVDAMNLRRFLRSISYFPGHPGMQESENPPTLADLVRIKDKACWIWRGVCHKQERRTIDAKLYPRFLERLVSGQDRQWYANRYAYHFFRNRSPVQRIDRVLNVCGEQLCVCPYPSHNLIVDVRMSKPERDGILRPGKVLVRTDPRPVPEPEPEFTPSIEEFMHGKKPH